MPFYELSRQFGKSREERKKCWRKPLKILQLRRWKTWFSLTSEAEVDSASEWIRANGFREDYIEGKDDFAVKRHTQEFQRRRRRRTKVEGELGIFFTFVCCISWNILFDGGFLRNPFLMDSEHASACAILPMHISHVVPQKYGQVGGRSL